MLLMGIYFLSRSFQLYQGFQLKRALTHFTSSHGKGFIFGAVATMILQSSSAITVLTIGLVNGNILRFKNTIGIILGTNVGTTFTTQLITFNLGKSLLPLIICGLILYLIPFKAARFWSKTLLSFGLILVGLRLMTWSAMPLESNQLFINIWSKVDNHILYSIAIGTISTALLQSSSGVTAILLAFSPHGYLDLATSIGVILGTNIGTCFTAILASIHSSSAGKKVALAHLILNLGGVLLFYPFLTPFAQLIELTAESLPRQIANTQTLFNLISSLAVLPLAGKFGDFTDWLYCRIMT